MTNNSVRSLKPLLFAAVVTLVVVGAFSIYAATEAASASKTVTANTSVEGASPLVGKPVPEFSLPSLSGTGTVSPAQYRGKPLVINFFASWCVDCQKETPSMVRAAKSLAPAVAFIGVDENDVHSHAVSFVQKDGVTYPVAYDPKTILAPRYLLLGLPTTVFVNARGIVEKVVTAPLSYKEIRSLALKVAA